MQKTMVLKPALRSPKSVMRHYWTNSTATRNFMAFAFIFSMIILYMIWSTSSTRMSSTTETLHTSTTQEFKLQVVQPKTDPLPKLKLKSKNVSMKAPHLLGQLNKAKHVSMKTPHVFVKQIKTKNVFKRKRKSKLKLHTDIVIDTMLVCSDNISDTRKYIQNGQRSDYANLTTIYFVTPTYPRSEQIPELTRLAHTLMHVPQLHWIVANDHPTCNVFLDYVLNKFGIPFTHLSSPMPEHYRHVKDVPRGVANRRAALHWLRQRNVTRGVLYFGDDDNTFDLTLFNEIRETRRVSMFPVGLIGEYAVSGPVVKEGKVVGFFDSWTAKRRWPVDMAGFAVNLAYLAQYPNATMPYTAGYEEDNFLRSIGLKMEYIEPLGNNCSKILVWHTRTEKSKMHTIRIQNTYLDDRTNLGALLKELETMGIVNVSETAGTRATISKNGKPKPIDYFLR